MNIDVNAVDTQTGEIVSSLPAMDEQEAVSWKADVARAANDLRVVLHYGYTREAWKALGFSSWTECLQTLADEFGLTERRLWQLHAANQIEAQLNNCSVVNIPEGQLHAANQIENLLNPGSVGQIPEKQLRPLTALEPDEQVAVWQQVIETAPDGNITARHVQEIVARRLDIGNNKPSVISGQPEYDGNEWYTPIEYLEIARQLMGGIDVDPASCDWAQARVQATTYYTKDTDGLSRDWPGRVWLNPPYSFPEIEQFTSRLQQQYEQGITTEAVLLVNNCTDSDWFQQLLQRYPVCFTNGRIKFERPGIDKFATRQGQAFFYLGTDVIGFADIFGAVGAVLTLMKVYA